MDKKNGKGTSLAVLHCTGTFQDHQFPLGARQGRDVILRDEAMLRLLGEMEVAYHRFEAGDPELLSSIGRLDAVFHEIVPETLQRISLHSRGNPNDFVLLED